MASRLSTSAVPREHTERGCNGRHDRGHTRNILPTTNHIEPAAESCHDGDEGKYLAENAYPANRAIVATTVDSILLRHLNDALGKSRHDGVELRQFSGCRKRSNPQLLALRDQRSWSFFLKLAVAITPLRHARRCRMAVAAVAARRWR